MSCAICDGTYGEDLAEAVRGFEGGCGWCQRDIQRERAEEAEENLASLEKFVESLEAFYG